MGKPLRNCYEAALEVIVTAPKLVRDQMRLCHGTPTGTGGEALGIRYGHAWVELGEGLVIDTSNGNDHIGSRERYYAVGSIDPDEVVRYTWLELAEHVAATGHSGPWHETDAVHNNDEAE